MRVLTTARLALVELQAHLHAELARVAAERAALRPAATMAKQARRLCHRLAGSISMAELALPTTARTHPPPPPPPPPVCWRRSVYVEVCRKVRMQRRALALAISLAAKQVEAESVEAATAAATALVREQASPLRVHPAQGMIATPLLQSSHPLKGLGVINGHHGSSSELINGHQSSPPLKGHLGELRALLCLSPAAIQLPLQPAHVRRAAEALGYALMTSDDL